MKKEQLTRQGVRDLDAKLGRVKKKPPLEEPPEQAQLCAHKRTVERSSGHTTCTDCGHSWGSDQRGR